MASSLKNLKTIAPCLLAITVDSLGFGLVYPILTMMFAGTHRTFLGHRRSPRQPRPISRQSPSVLST